MNPTNSSVSRHISRQQWSALGLSLALGGLLLAMALSGLRAGSAAAAGPAEPATAYACSEGGLHTALAAGGSATFNCAVPTTVLINAVNVVNKDASLDGGNKLILSGGNLTSVFTVATGVHLDLLNLTVRDASGGTGAAVNNHGALNTTHVTFFNNLAGIGAVLYNAPGAVANLSDTSVISNISKGGVVWNGETSAPFSATLTVAGSTFSQNQAIEGGAIVNNAGMVTVTGSSFDDNLSELGGAIFNNAWLRVDDTQFTGNQGGSFTLAASSLLNRRPEGPAAPAVLTTGGGAIYVSSVGDTIVHGSTFSNNRGQAGGAIFNSDLLDVSNSVFISNTAVITTAEGGGAIDNYIGGGLSVAASTFMRNLSKAGGGAIMNDPLALAHIVGSDFSQNFANGGYGGGGAIGNFGALYIDYSHFTTNGEARSSTFGGGAINSQQPLILAGAQPSAQAPQGIGPANFLSIDHSTFTANESDNQGGALNAGPAVVSHSTFQSNTAPYGGAIEEQGRFTMTADTFVGNMAVTTFLTTAQQGGAIDANFWGTTILNSTFYNNRAEGSATGGALNVDFPPIRAANAPNITFSSVAISYSTFLSNTADTNGNGAAIYQANFGLAALSNVLLAHNNGGDCNLGAVFNGENLEYLDSSCGEASRSGDPKALAPANNGGPTFTSALLPGSDAIDHGDNTGCPATDQRGGHRPFGAQCDIGAYEFGALVPRLWLPLLKK